MSGRATHRDFTEAEQRALLLEWADVGDNRIGPLLRELIDALMEEDDPDIISAIGSRLRYLSSSVNSLAWRRRNGRIAILRTAAE